MKKLNNVRVRIATLATLAVMTVVPALATDPPTFDPTTAASEIRDSVVTTLNAVWPVAAGLLAIFLGIRIVTSFMKRFSKA